MLALLLLLLSSSTSVSSSSSTCNQISADEQAKIQAAIQSNAVVIFGIRNTRCAMAAEDRLERASACYKFEEFSMTSATWDYFKCLHPNEMEGGVMMHSYVYIGRQFVGNGFALLEQRMPAATLTSKLAAAGAATTCAKDCVAATGLPQSQVDEIDRIIKTQPVVLYGWAGCPCTSIAEQRFSSKGTCFVEHIWPEGDAAIMRFLQCRYGGKHHSFIFISGAFFSDGFAFAQDAMSDAAFSQLMAQGPSSSYEGSAVSYGCQKAGDKNLQGTELQSCSQASDATTTGWTRSGSCVWDASDSGFHQVCVKMSDTFLQSSAKNDANDLSSVVQEGGHWCICAWAWASAVTRDPDSNTPQGIVLDCERTNRKLRDVYQYYITNNKDIVSPSGIGYKAATALAAVNRICGHPKSGADEAPSASSTAHIHAAATAGAAGAGSTSQAAPTAISTTSTATDQQQQQQQQQRFKKTNGGSSTVHPRHIGAAVAAAGAAGLLMRNV